jgi:hypothetical protein
MMDERAIQHFRLYGRALIGYHFRTHYPIMTLMSTFLLYCVIDMPNIHTNRRAVDSIVLSFFTLDSCPVFLSKLLAVLS